MSAFEQMGRALNTLSSVAKDTRETCVKYHKYMVLEEQIEYLKKEFNLTHGNGIKKERKKKIRKARKNFLYNKNIMK